MLLTQAIVLMMLGDHNGALQSLERIRSSAPPGFLPSAVLRLDPTWDPLRGEARFQALGAVPDRS